jgi:hypothetical protein
VSAEPTIRSGNARAYTIAHIPFRLDGTIAWNSTTLIMVELQAANAIGFGYTYAHRTAAIVARELIEKYCMNQNPLNGNAICAAMRASQRNYGAEGNRGEVHLLTHRNAKLEEIIRSVKTSRHQVAA